MSFPSLDAPDFTRRFAYICAVVAAVGLALATGVFLFRLVLLVVLGCVLAQLFSSLAEPLAAHLPGPRGLWLGASVLLVFGAAVGLVALFLFPVAQQLGQLVEALPRYLARLEKLLDRMGGPQGGGDRPSFQTLVSEKLPGVAATGLPFVLELMEGAFDFLGVFFFGAFVAASPEAHREGFLMLWPASLQPRIEAFLDEAGHALRAWLGVVGWGMTIVGSLATLGLWWIGVDYWLIFGLITAGLELIPFAGPLLGFVGPFATCLIEGHTRKAAAVVGLYFVCRVLMSYVINPYLVKKKTDIPASLAIASIVGLGTAAGALGVLAAVPLVAIVLAAVRTLTHNRTLGASATAAA